LRCRAPRQLVALGLPLGGHLGRLLLQVGQFLLQLLQPVLRGRVVLLLQRLGLDLHLQDLPVERVQLLGLAVHLHPQTAGASSIRSIALSGRNRSVM
jgi:hypothetical protein